MTTEPKDARDISPEEWRKALQNPPQPPKAAPKPLPDARTLTSAEFRQALDKMNTSR
jgi:hypothetical protein